MKMKYKKKHHKQLLNFSILLLFLLVLNINFAFTVKNYELKNITDNYKVNYEDLNPELIVESPKNANYIDNLDFKPYGTYIFAPKYFQRFVNQPGLDNIYFDLYDANERDFSQYSISVDEVEQNIFILDGNTIGINIAPFLTTNGVHYITVNAFSDSLRDWVTHNSILNVTTSKPCIAPFYSDFMHIQASESNLGWNIDVLDPSHYNYSIYINEVKVHSYNNSFDNSIDFNYPLFGDFFTLDKVNEIKLEIKDENGEVTINRFNITNAAADSYPIIDSLERNNYDISHLTLWETEGFKINVRGSSSQNDLGKIVVCANNLPIYTIEDAKNDITYEVPIDTHLLNKLRNENDYYGINLEFRAFAINKYGESSDIDSSPYDNIDLRYYDYFHLIEKTEDVDSGRNIETINIIEERNSNIEYTLTVVTDVLEPTTLTIAGSTGEQFEYNGGWDHCYEDVKNEEEDYNCHIFGGYEDFEYHDENNDYYIEDRGGMVFWVSATNQSKVQFPMIVKIVYPEEIQPDGINKNWNLQFMHWIDNIETNNRNWYVYRNETVSENRDETLKIAGDNAIEVLIYSQGLYAFGIEPGDDYENRGFFISSFPIGLILSSIGIAIITVSLKTRFKIKKK